MARSHVVLILLLIAAISLSGGDAPTPDRSGRASGSEYSAAEAAAFGDVFRLHRRIALREPEGVPLAAVTALSLAPDGRIAVADRKSSRIFVFDEEGRALGVVGRPGDGPGEFRRPIDVAFDALGRLYVADLAAPRITRFDRSFRLDTAFRLEGVRYPQQIDVVEGRVLAYVAPVPPETRRLRFYSLDGRRLAEFHPGHAAYRETPYWSAAAESRMAASRSAIVAGANLLYPFPRYDGSGSLVDSVGTPPRRWRAAPRPERGQFRGPDRFRRFAAWRRTFTTIESVAFVADDLLVVNHRALDPEVLAYEEASYFADVYRTADWAKRWTGLEPPGRILRGGEALYVLEREPPDRWTIGVYGLRR